MIYHDISWHFVIKIKIYHIVAKARNFGIFVAKIYDYTLFDIFWGSAGLIDSPTTTIYATLRDKIVQSLKRAPISNIEVGAVHESGRHQTWALRLLLSGQPRAASEYIIGLSNISCQGWALSLFFMLNKDSIWSTRMFEHTGKTSQGHHLKFSRCFKEID